MSSKESEITTDESNTVQSVRMTLTNSPEVKFARSLNLTMKSTWRTKDSIDRFVAYEGVKLTTRVARPGGWDGHLNLRGAILDLVSFAAWRPFGFSSIEVLRTDDPIRTVNSAQLQENWCSISMRRVLRHEPWTKKIRFLFLWEEIGPSRVARWLELRSDYYQTIGLILNVLHSDDVWSHSSTVQTVSH